MEKKTGLDWKYRRYLILLQKDDSLNFQAVEVRSSLSLSLVFYQSIHKQLPSKSIEPLLDQVPKVRYALTLGDT